MLFLGKFTRLSQDELKKFVEKLGFNFATNYEKQNIALTVFSTIINPNEEAVANTLYENKIPEVSLEEFEAYYISTLKPNSLLMSLKLSNNQDRLISFLKSKAINNELFLKLLKLYNWQNEDIFDSDSNRDVTLAFINRFYPKKESFNHNEIAHSPSTILDIAITQNNPDVLEAMLKIPNFSFNARGQERWKPRALREFIAINPTINSYTKRFLLNLNDNRIFNLIALNQALNKNEQIEIYDKLDLQGKINLSSNENLDKKLFQRLLKEDAKIVETLLAYQKVDKNILSQIKKEHLQFLANNPYLESIKNELLFKDKELDFALSSNKAINQDEIKKLYEKYSNEIAINLAKNPNISPTMLEEFYKQNNFQLTKIIASNPNTPEYIIDELFNKDSFELNIELAKNPNLKSDYIEYFKLDSRLLQIMSEIQDIKSKIITERV